jgi:hypothetical protein
MGNPAGTSANPTSNALIVVVMEAGADDVFFKRWTHDGAHTVRTHKTLKRKFD